MALPDFLKYEVGAVPLTWKNTGGTYGLTLTSVTNGNGRQGAKGDLGANRARIWDVLFTASVGVAATAGNEIELYWAASDSATAGTDNPGGTGGTDATFNTTPDEYKQQLIFIGSLILSNNAGTGIQKQWFRFQPPTRYGMPVVVNKSGQTMGSTATDHTVTLTPREEAVEDTA
jgi:hypothetical protein